jgi:hypothetical protein
MKESSKDFFQHLHNFWIDVILSLCSVMCVRPSYQHLVTIVYKSCYFQDLTVQVVFTISTVVTTQSTYIIDCKAVDVAINTGDSTSPVYCKLYLGVTYTAGTARMSNHSSARCQPCTEWGVRIDHQIRIAPLVSGAHIGHCARDSESVTTVTVTY